MTITSSEQLQQERLKRQLTYSELSRRSGVPRQYLRAWENGIDPRVIDALEATPVPSCARCGTPIVDCSHPEVTS